MKKLILLFALSCGAYAQPGRTPSIAAITSIGVSSNQVVDIVLAVGGGAGGATNGIQMLNGQGTNTTLRNAATIGLTNTGAFRNNGNATIAGDISVTGALAVSGNGSVSGTLSAPTTDFASLSVSGASVLRAGLTATNVITSGLTNFGSAGFPSGFTAGLSTIDGLFLTGGLTVAYNTPTITLNPDGGATFELIVGSGNAFFTMGGGTYHFDGTLRLSNLIATNSAILTNVVTAGLTNFALFRNIGNMSLSGTLSGDGGGLSNAFWVAAGDNITLVTNSARLVTISAAASGGSSNAVSTISTNGGTVGTGITTLGFTNSSTIDWFAVSNATSKVTMTASNRFITLAGDVLQFFYPTEGVGIEMDGANNLLTFSSVNANHFIQIADSGITFSGTVSFGDVSFDTLNVTDLNATNVYTMITNAPVLGTDANGKLELATPGTDYEAALTDSASLRTTLSDESGTGVAIFGDGNIGAGSATTAAFGSDTTLIATTEYVERRRGGTNTWGNTELDFSRGANVLTNMAGPLTIASVTGFSSDSRLHEQYIRFNASGADRVLTVPADWYVSGFTNATIVTITNGTVAWACVTCIRGVETNITMNFFQ